MATKKNDKKQSKPEATPAATKGKSLSEMVDALAEKTGLSKAQVRGVLDAQTEVIVDELKSSGQALLAGIGKLKIGTRAERQGRNPSTGETITIKAAKTVKFSGGKTFKENFND